MSPIPNAKEAFFFIEGSSDAALGKKILEIFHPELYNKAGFKYSVIGVSPPWPPDTFAYAYTILKTKFHKTFVEENWWTDAGTVEWRRFYAIYIQ